MRVPLFIITFNSRHHLTDLARHYLHLSPPIAVYIVDNSSTDGTAVAAREMGFSVIETGTNQGYGSACNYAARAVSSDVYVFANPDVRIGAGDLYRLISHARADGPPAPARIGFVGPVYGPAPWRAMRFSSIQRDIYAMGPRRLRPLLRLVSGNRWSDTTQISETSNLALVDYPLGALLVVRADAFSALGGFDERFFLYSEEEDLCLRGRRLGWCSAVLPNAQAEHAGSTSSIDHTASSLSGVRLASKLQCYAIHRGQAYATVARCVIAALISLHQANARARSREPVFPSGTVSSILNPRRESQATILRRTAFTAFLGRDPTPMKQLQTRLRRLAAELQRRLH